MKEGIPETKQGSRLKGNLAFERLVRNSLFTLIFIIVAVISVRLLIWGNLEKFRSQHGDEVQKRLIVAHKQEIFFEAFKEYKAFKQASAPKLAHPNYKDSVNTLNQLLGRHFSKIQIQASTEEKHSQDEIMHEIFHVKAHASSLRELYAFLDGMRQISAYTQMALPINIAKEAHGLALDFRIHIEYKLTEF
ncbi:hypothetical protein [Helicobacter salomonis]|uniref:hypothetical protein n=1 Tax=Helicobacter salomonis TaxID=56878 RepID=UPI000CF0EE94|nr:hypothetical protein [Helicobacter salomonis]